MYKLCILALLYVSHSFALPEDKPTVTYDRSLNKLQAMQNEEVGEDPASAAAEKRREENRKRRGTRTDKSDPKAD